MREDIGKEGLEVKIDARNVSTIEASFKTYYMQLLNYARSFLNDKDEAEDIVQGVFYQLLKKEEAIDVSKPLNSYLFTAVRNSCIKRINHMKIKAQYKENAVHFDTKSSNSTMEKVINNELENEFRNAINDLPEQCKLIFTMSRQSGLKYTEIAECLNISVKTVEKQMGKALKVLRERLKNYLPIHV